MTLQMDYLSDGTQRDLPPVPPLAPVPAWERRAGQGGAEVEAAAEEGERRGGVHHSTTALGNFGTTRYRVFRVTIPRWDQNLAHPS